MNRKQEIFQSVLTNPYNNDNFIGFVREFLNNVEMVAPNRYVEVRSNFSFYVNGYYHIGNYISDDGDKIAVISVCLNRGDTVERARGMQRNFVKPLIESGGCAGALVAFYTKDEPNKWRLSFIRMDYEFSKGKVTEKLTPAKRYSYLVGKGEPCHTAQTRLYPIFLNDVTNPGIDELEEAFSVEKVTKEFFDLYCEKYHQLREYLESNKEFMIEAECRKFTSEQFAKKLLGQIVFLYFIQKKGWLGVEAIPVTLTEKAYKNAFFAKGTKSREIMPKVYKEQPDGTYRIIYDELKKLSDEDEEILAGIVKGKPWGSGPKDFMRKIFEGCKSAGKNYFDDYLEPLFYTGLNKNRGENGFYAPLHRRIPFLNGGLFEQLDNYEWEHNNFAIPNELFSNADTKGRDADGILDIFDRYNFTMNEDEPMEREVAIDPEMLGKVFENLLDVSDRKSKGAFYTPREIVHYMCQETLINYLVTKSGLPETDIRDFVLYGDLMKDEDTTKASREGNRDMLISSNIFDLQTGVNRLKELDDLLANVRVADLAVGSGAFPLGMLNEIVKARETLSAYMAIGMNAFQKKSFYAYDRKPYDLKVNTIKNCIYACDIEPSAVDIAKLRLWLSIVIDDEIAAEAGNGEFDAHTKPRQLPNLDCNIICGNSLIDEFKGNKLISESELLHNVSENSQMTMYQGGVDSLIGELIKLQDKLFFVKEHDEKEEIKQKIQDIYNQIILEQLQGSPEQIEEYYEAIKEPSKPFVLWQLYFPNVFRDNGGFDIVIGNPPYVSTKGQGNDEKNDLMKIYGFADDLYYHFIVKAFELLNEDGTNSMITPDTYFTTGTKVGLRDELTKRRLIALVHLGHDVFESAMVSTAIFVSSNKPNSHNEMTVIDVKGKESLGEGVKYRFCQDEFIHSMNKAFFVPDEANILIHNKMSAIQNELLNTYGSMIMTSKDISKNAKQLSAYRDKLCYGDWTLIGLVTEGGQGLATANNGKFVGVKEGTKEASRIRATRGSKLAEVNQTYHTSYELPCDESEIWELFENIKEKYGRDVFGQGYLYRIVPDSLICDISEMSIKARDYGISGEKTYVPYEKGDKDGNRWYLETPYLIDWSEENVTFLRENSGKKGKGMPVVRNQQFYFREGFCYSDIKTFFIRCRLKGKSIHDVKSMSLFPVAEKIPYYYLISLINSKLIATVIYNFLNNTPSFQINDCRILPIPVPTEESLKKCKILFDDAINIQKEFFAGKISKEQRDEVLAEAQKKIDLYVCDLYDIEYELLSHYEE